VIVELIAATTTTETSLRVACELDRNSYPSGFKVTKEDMAGIRLRKDRFHGEWNYTILPRPRSRASECPGRPRAGAIRRPFRG
jgi:hypothetical protein